MSTLFLKVDTQELSVEITKLLSEESINKLAKETGFTIKESGKLTGFMFLDMLLFTHFNHKKLSLNDMSVQLKFRFGIKIRKQSIDERFTEKAVLFFKTVLGKALNISINKNEKINFTKYDRIRIKDSTSFQIPENMKDKYKGSGGSASKAAIKIQFEYDLKNGEILDLSIFPFVKQDITNAQETIDNIQANELIIRDLGYVKIGLLRVIEEKGAFYLNRIKSDVLLYEMKNGKLIEIDRGRLLRTMRIEKKTRILKEVYVGKEEYFKTRMIIELLPDKEYQIRVGKAIKDAKKKKRTLSDTQKAQLALNIFITNTNIPENKIRLLYTLRWQIELMFKIWKSIGEIDKVKKMKVERFKACLIAKLIWIIINWQITQRIVIYFFVNHNIEISLYKLFKTLKSEHLEFRTALKKGVEHLQLYIKEIIEISPDNHKSEKKKNTITWSYEIIGMFYAHK